MNRALANKQSGAGEGDSTAPKPIRLMIVDDSTVARAVLTRMIDASAGLEIVGVAGTAEDAIEALNNVAVDVVLLDLEMPGVGGLKSIPKIIEAAKGARVLVVSSLAEEGAEASVAALALGAADTLPKPGTGRFHGRFSEVLIGKIRELGLNPLPKPMPVPELPEHVTLRHADDGPISLLVIGASTGGIHAMGAFFKELPTRIGVPILVTQHLPPPFMPVFARQLTLIAQREAVVAEDGAILRPDKVYIAPGDAHLTVERHSDKLVARLRTGKVSSGCMPSVDPMLSSAAHALGAEVLAVVLTGMGRDGVEGAIELAAAGGTIIAQDEQSSAVWGMPRAIAEAGLASAILPPDRIARRVSDRVREAMCR